jgi:hypothetical protein
LCICFYLREGAVPIKGVYEYPRDGAVPIEGVCLSCMVLPRGDLSCVIVSSVSSDLAWMGSSESSA